MKLKTFLFYWNILLIKSVTAMGTFQIIGAVHKKKEIHIAKLKKN